MGVPLLFRGSCISRQALSRWSTIWGAGVIAIAVILPWASSAKTTEATSTQALRNASLAALYSFIEANQRLPIGPEVDWESAEGHSSRQAIIDFGGISGAVLELVEHHPPDDVVIAAWLGKEFGVTDRQDIPRENAEGIAVMSDGLHYAKPSQLVALLKANPPNSTATQLLQKATDDRILRIIRSLGESVPVRKIVDRRGAIVLALPVDQLRSLFAQNAARFLHQRQDLLLISEYLEDQRRQLASPYSEASLDRVAEMVRLNLHAPIVKTDYSSIQTDEDWKLLIDAHPDTRGRNKTQADKLHKISRTILNWFSRQPGSKQQKQARFDAIFDGIPQGFHSSDPLGPLVTAGLIGPFNLDEQVERFGQQEAATQSIVKRIAEDRRQRLELLVQHGILDSSEVDAIHQISSRNLTKLVTSGKIDPFVARLLGHRPDERRVRDRLYVLFERGVFPAPPADPGAREALTYLKHQKTAESSAHDELALERAIHVIEHHLHHPWENWRFGELKRAEDWKALVKAIPGTRNANTNQAVENGYQSVLVSCRSWAKKHYQGDKKRANQQIAAIFDGEAAGNYFLVHNKAGEVAIFSDSRPEAILFNLGFAYEMLPDHPVEGDDVHIPTGQWQSSLDWQVVRSPDPVERKPPILGRDAEGRFVEIDPETGDVLDHRKLAEQANSDIPLQALGPIIVEHHEEQQNEREQRLEAARRGQVYDFDAQRIASIRVPALARAEVLLTSHTSQFADLFTILARDPRVQALNPKLVDWDPDNFEADLRRARLEQTANGSSTRQRYSDEDALLRMHEAIEAHQAIPDSAILAEDSTLPGYWTYFDRWGGVVGVLAAMERTIDVSTKVRRILREQYDIHGQLDEIPQVNKDNIALIHGEPFLTIEHLPAWLADQGIDISRDSLADIVRGAASLMIQRHAVVGQPGTLNLGYNAHHVAKALSAPEWEHFLVPQAKTGQIAVDGTLYAGRAWLRKRYGVTGIWVDYHARKQQVPYTMARAANGHPSRHYDQNAFDRIAIQKGVFNPGRAMHSQ